MRRKEELAIFRHATFNVKTLCRLAGELREGHACFCDTSQIPASGGFNWSIFISFEEGVEWVLRSPRETGEIESTDTNVTLLRSEAATLKYIRALTKFQFQKFSHLGRKPHQSLKLILTYVLAQLGRMESAFHTSS